MSSELKEYQLYQSFLALSRMHLDAMKEKLGLEVMLGIATLFLKHLTPRAYIENHISCVGCELGGVSSAEDCMVVKMCKDVTEFADEAGHPEWVDGDPLLGDDITKV